MGYYGCEFERVYFLGCCGEGVLNVVVELVLVE